MNTELQKSLCDKHPAIFADIFGDPKETCMAFGVECGDGWYEIIDALCDATQRHIDSFNRMFPDANLKMKAAQIKSKYGTLRFYTDFTYSVSMSENERSRMHHYISQIDGMIMFAERMSARTCEFCGAAGKATKDSFPITICENCEKLRFPNG